MRTPLSAVNWALQEIQSPNLPAEDKNEILLTGQKAARKLSSIVNDFLNLAKIEEGRFGYNFEEADLVDFIAIVVDEGQPIAQQNGINLFYERPQEGISATFDKQKIGIVLSNLIDNAIKYNVKNGQVVVSLRKKTDESMVEIAISDTGVGIKPEDVQKLFTKFFRSDTTVKMDTTGSGIGLYIARNIVRQHGGTIWAESTLGRGTTFTFTLPTDPSLIPSREVGNFGKE